MAQIVDQLWAQLIFLKHEFFVREATPNSTIN